VTLSRAALRREGPRQDARTDVAVIEIEPKEPLTVLELGDSEIH
jgi:hypothetical protein